MTITMNGSWTIRVTQAADATLHRFLVSGADLGSGVHAGVLDKTISAHGAHWTLQVQRRIGHQAWRACDHRLGAASLSDGIVEFDIQADAGSGSLTLTCLRPLRPAHDAADDNDRPAAHEAFAFAWPAA